MFQHIIYFGECALKEFKFYSCWEQCSVNVNQVKLVDSVVKKIIFLFLLLLGLVFCCCFKAVHILNLFIYFRLHWVFVAAHRLSLVAASRGYSSLRCTGFSLQWLLLLQSTGSMRAGFRSCGTWAQQLWHVGSAVAARGLQSTGSVAVAHGLSCSAACGIFPDQGSNPCPLHWQADCQPLRHQGSPRIMFIL